jgi:hypothetical protein
MQIQGLHLTLGWIGLLVMSILVCLRRSSLYIKFSTIYFAAFIFNNYAYSFASIRFSEVFGILAAITVFFSPFSRRALVGYAILLTAFITFLHMVIVQIIYPEIDSDTQRFFIRIILIGRIYVLGVVAIGFNKEFNTEDKINQLIKDIVYFGLIGIGVYLIQFLVLATGSLPFGTFLDAGFTGFPSFGSVSVERGHFAKLFVPLFPFFAIFLINEKKFVFFLLYIFVSLINFSASGQFFLLCYLLVSVFFFKKYLANFYSFLLLMFFSSSLYVMITKFFKAQFLGIIEKIYTLGLQGGGEEGIGGRGIDILFKYLEYYPLGISFGGSTLRKLTNLPAINMGLYAFISQFSILSIPLIIGFTYLNYVVILKSRSMVDKKIRKILLTGIFVSGIIYCVDVLWFIPTIWLPLIICNQLSQLSKFRNYKIEYIPQIK